MISDNSSQGPKRPLLVWVICASYAASVIVPPTAVYLAYSGRIPVSAADAAYLRSFTLINFAGLALGLLLLLISTVQLFRMRRSAPYLLTATLVVAIVKQFIYRPELNRLGHSYVPALVSGVIALLVVIYSWRLLMRGTLK
jgi:hypothetical protein